jgi:putative transposase
MPRRRLFGTGGVVFHVMNRSAKQLPLFECPSDFRLFVDVLVAAGMRCSMRLLEYCVMSNHFHLLLWPYGDNDLTRYLQWATGVHGQRWRRARRSTGKGAVYQGRYRWVGIQDAVHYDNARRYILQNPVRAGLVENADDWPWSSASSDAGVPRPTLTPPPFEPLTALESPLDGHSVERIRSSLRASQSLGPAAWSHALEVESWLKGVLAQHEKAITASGLEKPEQ